MKAERRSAFAREGASLACAASLSRGATALRAVTRAAPACGRRGDALQGGR